MPTATRENERTVAEASLNAFLAQGCLVLDEAGRAWIGWGEVELGSGARLDRLSLYAPNFFLGEERPWRLYSHWANVDAEALIADLDRHAAPVPHAEWRPSAFEEFAASFDDIQHRLADGTLAKAVPFIARRATIEFTAARRAFVIASALRRCRGAALRAYGVWDAEGGMVGTTPETLFEEREGEPPSLATMALAGTRTSNAPSLLDDPKEMHEHRVVVEGIAESLAPLGRVIVGRTGELRLPTLVHLHTPIEAFPERRVAFDEWVAALHPTAAIGAWPREAGWRWLHEQPNAGERGRYGAPFGLVPPGATVGTCLVAIRNLQWSGDQARLLAGCGIVGESRVDREWRELNAKLDSVQGALGL